MTVALALFRKHHALGIFELDQTFCFMYWITEKMVINYPASPNKLTLISTSWNRWYVITVEIKENSSNRSIIECIGFITAVNDFAKFYLKTISSSKIILVLYCNLKEKHLHGLLLCLTLRFSHFVIPASPKRSFRTLSKSYDGAFMGK